MPIIAVSSSILYEEQLCTISQDTAFEYGAQKVKLLCVTVKHCARFGYFAAWFQWDVMRM